MEEVVFQQDKFRFYGSCATGILALLGALYSEIWVFWLLFGASLLLSYRHYQDLQKRIVVSKEGITDEGGQFYAWKDIDHCYLENPNLVLVFKKKNWEVQDHNYPICLSDYNASRKELEETINRLSGKPLFVQKTFEDKEQQKKEDKEATKGILIFIGAIIAGIGVIALFAHFYSR